MNKPENLYEQASYDLNQFRERRIADRRFTGRGTPDRRRASQTESKAIPAPENRVADDKGREN